MGLIAGDHFIQVPDFRQVVLMFAIFAYACYFLGLWIIPAIFYLIAAYIMQKQ